MYQKGRGRSCGFRQCVRWRVFSVIFYFFGRFDYLVALGPIVVSAHNKILPFGWRLHERYNFHSLLFSSIAYSFLKCCLFHSLPVDWLRSFFPEFERQATRPAPLHLFRLLPTKSRAIEKISTMCNNLRHQFRNPIERWLFFFDVVIIITRV